MVSIMKPLMLRIVTVAISTKYIRIIQISMIKHVPKLTVPSGMQATLLNIKFSKIES